MNLEELIKKGKYEELVKIFEKRKPEGPEEMIPLGIAYYGLGRKNKAISVFRKVLKEYPNNPDALFNLAEIYHQLEKWNKVKEFAFEYLKKDPNNWAILDIVSDVFVFEGEYEKAIEYLKKAVQYSSGGVRNNLKEKLAVLKNRYEQAKKQKKLAFICAYGLDSFIDDIIKGLSNDYWVRKFLVRSNQDVYKAIDWADIVWFEWANEVAIVGTNYPGVYGKRVLVRLHGYEVFTEMPMKIKWDVVDKVIFVAKHKKELFFQRFGKIVEPSKSILIRNGIDTTKFTIP
ncbi:MAG: tetratricopeptide repeat protein, partial [Thermoplasmata archaeon]|nr:tetratricopeptide repeat protein [Thermoplasmata archaeon]